ncbi:aromatic-ring-hydroxylating dioxygenase subunit beta [Mycobacterium lentiflavum]|uniref:Aromatic-ring-hydroxylating dioxygenase subunit beta n=1 Tax=Mycobacterium lentiflavum TaxID=141349 RepID=A0ABY3US92_MYCLN|nr:aromatic-ring-hydroxylating dioxygenase subunit beta [Mycobacterium lentiflavum]ULP41587.1 aromatic-ring-hydroxylating dioxygenase subunit beta [Mycobacterium lentiflavum]
MTIAVPSQAIDAQLLATVTQFLGLEARLLDEGREDEWLELLDDEVLYVVPIRQATVPRANEVDHAAFRLRDTKAHVRTRIERLHTGHAYSEIPPSRTLRMVGSIEITGVQADVVSVTSAVLVYRQRGIDAHFDLIPARRYDRIRISAHGPRLLSREVVLTETSVATPNLGIFL